MKSPSDAVVSITSHCNARCTMCSIWKSDRRDRLSPKDMRKLPADLKTINLTGGEPFLRDDLPLFVREARSHCPEAMITVSTNGGDSERVLSMMSEIRKFDPDIRLAVSIDGPREVHNRVRGGDFYDSAVKVIEQLSAEGFRGLRLAMTISAMNAEYIDDVMELAERFDLELGIIPAHGAETHLGITEAEMDRAVSLPRSGFRRAINRWLRSWNSRFWLRAHFAARAYRYLQGHRASFRCGAGRDFFFVHSDGVVYGCSVCGGEMGNLHSGDWNGIMLSEAADSVRRAARKCRRGCWMICTARSVYRAHRFRTALWVLWHKLLAHLWPAGRKK